MITAGIIQARSGSTRLPGKILLELNSKSLLEFQISQLQFCKSFDKLIIATTTLEEDDPIVELAKKLSIDFFRGDPNDVLDRYYKCAKFFSISTIIRITSDNPLIDPEVVDEMVVKFNSKEFDYVTNTQPRTFPQGTEVEVFSFNALEKSWNDAILPSEREHVTPYFYNNPKKFKIHNITYSKNLSHLRWTVDRQSDYDFVKTIVSKISKRPISFLDVVNLLEREPSLIDINKNYEFDEGYKKSLKEDKYFRHSFDK